MWGEGGMRESRADPAPCPLFRAAVPIPVSGPPFPVRERSGMASTICATVVGDSEERP